MRFAGFFSRPGRESRREAPRNYDIQRNHRQRRSEHGQHLVVPRGYVHVFKLSKRYLKTVNKNVISLGFPEQTLPKWLNGYVYEWVQDGLLRCRMRKKFDEVEFHNWKEVAFEVDLNEGQLDQVGDVLQMNGGGLVLFVVLFYAGALRELSHLLR